MEKKYIVRLTGDEREKAKEVIKRLSGSSEKVRRAQILIATDVDGLGWTDERIAEAYGCRRRTVETIRQRFVERGFEETLERKRRDYSISKKLSGEQEAKIIALRLGDPPKGYSNWSLRLLARRVVELSIADEVSHETVRALLKKRL